MQSSTTILESFMMNDRSEEHTSELQSHVNLVCRLLLEKKKQRFRRARAAVAARRRRRDPAADTPRRQHLLGEDVGRPPRPHPAPYWHQDEARPRRRARE